MCAVHSRHSSVLSCTAHFFFCGRGRCAVNPGCVHARATSTSKGVTVCAPSGQPTLDIAHTESRAECSPPVRTLGLSTALQSGVRHSCAGRMRAQNAVRSERQQHYRDSAQLAGIGRCCGCFPTLRFSVCAVPSRVPRFITVLPLPWSLD